MDYEALLEVLKTDIRAQIALAALIISLYALFRTSHKEKDHVEIILEKPVRLSTHVYTRVDNKFKKKESINKVLHGRVLINNSSRHNIGYFGLSVNIDGKEMQLLNGKSFLEGDQLFISIPNKNHHINRYVPIAEGGEYINGNIEERSQRRILFVATSIDGYDIPEGKTIKIKFHFLKSNFLSSIPLINKIVPQTKKIKFRLKYNDLKNFGDDLKDGKSSIKRI